MVCCLRTMAVPLTAFEASLSLYWQLVANSPFCPEVLLELMLSFKTNSNLVIYMLLQSSYFTQDKQKRNGSVVGWVCVITRLRDWNHVRHFPSLENTTQFDRIA